MLLEKNSGLDDLPVLCKKEKKNKQNQTKQNLVLNTLQKNNNF